MELVRLIEALCNPAVYPHPVAAVRVCQTHISAVFLAGELAYKIKKPVDLTFLDFRTIERRRHFAEEEVRLNRRLAPGVYLGVVPVTRDGERVAVEGSGEVVEWAVKMTRLPEEATLGARLRRGEDVSGVVEVLAQRIAAFHAAAESGPDISAGGGWEVVARNARENFQQAEPAVGTTVSRNVFDRLRERTEAALDELRPVIEERAERGVPRDTHGDLRLEHVYVFPEREPPDDLAIVDCIEFSERFRFADPVADMAFLVMDLAFAGRRDLARALAEGYFRASGDEPGRALVPFYVAYRSAVRGKVQGFELAEREIPEAKRAAALVRARAHWLLALGELEEPARRPALLLVGGLPGSGKSTLARDLAERAGFEVVRSDVVRKELAGLSEADRASATFGEGLYTPEWSERTYAECLRRAEALLFEGRRVLVDASFGKEARRRAFLEAATRWGVPSGFLLCAADPDTVRTRLAQRRNDASDADVTIYEQAARHWEPPGPATCLALHTIATDGGRETAVVQALDVLRQLDLR